MRHTIEVIVDRLAIRHGIEKRLQRLAGGRVQVRPRPAQDRAARRPRRQARSISASASRAWNAASRIRRSTPRMFSFNSPHGACAACSGIGSIMYFDPELVVQNEDLSIADGAIAPWATMNYMQPVLEALAAALQVQPRHAVEKHSGQGARARSSTARATRRSRSPTSAASIAADTNARSKAC